MPFSPFRIVFSALVLVQIVLMASWFATVGYCSPESSTELGVEGRAVKRDNIFNFFFGGAPMMPTRHGTVIVEAFHDRNNNQVRDPGEETLDGEILCTVNGITYSVPAFIPGLENGLNYTFYFEGENYQPTIPRKNVFIRKRGQIIRIEIPSLPQERYKEANPS